MLKTVLLWRSRRVRQRRKEKKQVCLRGRGGWGLSLKETWRRAGWRPFKGEGRAAGAEDGRSPVLPRCRQEAGGAEVRMEEWSRLWERAAIFSVFTEQKETQEAGDKDNACYSEYVRMLGGSRKGQAGERPRCPEQGEWLPRGLKERWGWERDGEEHCWKFPLLQRDTGQGRGGEGKPQALREANRERVREMMRGER